MDISLTLGIQQEVEALPLPFWTHVNQMGFLDGVHCYAELHHQFAISSKRFSVFSIFSESLAQKDLYDNLL